jgi:hypothetical protein
VYLREKSVTREWERGFAIPLMVIRRRSPVLVSGGVKCPQK